MNPARAFRGGTAHLLCRMAGDDPGRSALSAGGSACSLGELSAQVLRLAATLRDSGVGPGDRVALLCGNQLEFAAGYYGVLAAGAVAVPMSYRSGSQVWAELMARTGARLVLAGGESCPAEARESLEGLPGETGGAAELHYLEALLGAKAGPGMDAPVVQAARDEAVILFTSGTTGQAKGVILSHHGIEAAALSFAARIGMGPGDTVLIALPLTSSFGQIALLGGALLSGARAVVLPRFAPAAAWEALAAEGATVFVGVPTMYHGLLAAADGAGAAVEQCRARLRFAGVGGAPVPSALVERFHAATGLMPREGYGLSETCSVTAFHGPAEAPRPGACGAPLDCAEVCIVNGDLEPLGPGQRGEVLVGGPHIMLGYLDGEGEGDAPFHQEMLRTGDAGYLDQDGYLHIVDRLKDVIIRGGQNIYPHEVETVLRRHPGIEQVAVAGLPDERLGEEVGAFIVPVACGAELQPELGAWLEGQLPRYARPRHVILRESLPMGETGKVLRRVLRDAWLADQGNAAQRP